LVTARINNLDSILDELSPKEVVRLMSDYVRSVSHAVFQRGGTIERISADGLLAYFARLGKDLSIPIQAAVELAGRLKQVGRELGGKSSHGLKVSIALHVGDVLVLNVGGERYMIQTVIGEAMRVAEALLDGNSEGLILATEELAAAAGEGIAFKEGPEISIPGREHPLKTLCLISSPLPDYPSDPTTLTMQKPNE
jgi:adenylate cyclase